MKFSLRSLILVVTVAAVLIGLWGENWRTCRMREREHAEQAEQLDENVQAELMTLSGSGFLLPELQRQAHEHHRLAAEYRQAIWQPWKRWWIEEPAPQDPKP
jgi:hypothetical protein